MNYRGSMEGWEPKECTGHCGRCSDCYETENLKGDQQYEDYRYEQLEQSDE